MKNIIILTAAASTFALTAAAQIQLGDESVMEPLVQGGLVDGGIVDGEENMEIDPDMMDRTPDFMPDTDILELEQEGPLTLSPDESEMSDIYDDEDNDETLGGMPQAFENEKDTAPKVMPKK